MKRTGSLAFGKGALQCALAGALVLFDGDRYGAGMAH